MKLCDSAAEAVSIVRSGQRVFVQGCAATPNFLLSALGKTPKLTDLEFTHLHTEGDTSYLSNHRSSSLFVGKNLRKSLDYERHDFLPCFLSEIPALFRSGRRPIDVALIQVSPPDKHGYCSLGVSVDVTLSAVQNAKVVIAQINPQMPRVHGDGIIHLDRIHYAVEQDSPLPQANRPTLSSDEKKIGQLVSELVEDGATIQLGIGSIPDAVTDALSGHQNLGLHSEMWSDGTLRLIEKGVINNSQKKVHPGKSLSTFLFGSKKLYDFIDDNPSVIQLTADYVNSIGVIARNPKVVAINSAVEVDLTGQVCADSIGPRIISGIGGQMDFMRGASLSPGGKPVIALLSRTNKGESRIASALRRGSGVVTTRGHVHHLVTEYGRVDLYGKTLSERAKLMISIAHPEDRERLKAEWTALHR